MGAVFIDRTEVHEALTGLRTGRAAAGATTRVAQVGHLSERGTAAGVAAISALGTAAADVQEAFATHVDFCIRAIASTAARAAAADGQAPQ